MPQQPLKFNTKEVYTFYTFYFHKWTVDKHIFKKAETETGFRVNDKKKLNVNYGNFNFSIKLQ